MKRIEETIIERVEAALKGTPGSSVNSGDLKELLRVAKEHAAMLDMPEIATAVSRVEVSTATIISNVLNSNVVVSGNAKVGEVLSIGRIKSLTIE